MGTSSEHNVLYNYQVANASNVYMALIQTETPYYQSNPDASTPFTSQVAFADPVFTGGALNNKAWGLRVIDSEDIFVYGAGLYSFFENYDQKCVPLQNCQGKPDTISFLAQHQTQRQKLTDLLLDNMVDIKNSGKVHLYGLSTKAAVNQVTVEGKSAALDKDNRNNFCAAIALFEVQDSSPTKCK